MQGVLRALGPGCGLFCLMLVQRQPPVLHDQGGEDSAAGQHNFPEAVVQPGESSRSPIRSFAARSSDGADADLAGIQEMRILAILRSIEGSRLLRLRYQVCVFVLARSLARAANT